jgi:hypothetical protein
MPPAYVKPYVKRQKNDATDAETICEAVTRPNMRFVPTKTAEQQSCLMLHRTRHLFIRQQTATFRRGSDRTQPADGQRRPRASMGAYPYGRTRMIVFPVIRLALIRPVGFKAAMASSTRQRSRPSRRWRAAPRSAQRRTPAFRTRRTCQHLRGTVAIEGKADIQRAEPKGRD